MKTHKDLDVWKEAISLVTDVYELMKSYPKEEKYSLCDQMKRSAVSVPSNIAEGAARKSKKEHVQFLFIAMGSLSELETQLIISKNLSFIDEKALNVFEEKISNIMKMLNGLIRYLRKTEV